MTVKLTASQHVELFKSGFFTDVLIGNVGNSETKTRNDGGLFYKFSVAKSVGKGSDKVTVWFNCTSNDDFGLSKGDKVLVFGEYFANEGNDGKIYHNMQVGVAQCIQKAGAKKEETPNTQQAEPEDVAF